MKRKLVTLLLALCACLGVGAFTACDKEEGADNSDDSSVVEELAFEFSSGCYVVTGIGDVTGTEVIIPDTYMDVPVKEVAPSAFENCTNLTSVTIGANVMTIDDNAFNGCSNLTNINIKNVLSIGAKAFNGCESLTDIDLTKVSSIGDDAFNGCESLTTITIGEGIQSLGACAFQNCTGLTEINFDAIQMDDLSSANFVFSHAGQDGTGITVNIGASVREIPAYLFTPYGTAPNITDIVFEDDGVCEDIGKRAFFMCENLTDVVIPDSVSFIGESAFGSCKGLTNITIGKNVTSIGNSAFDSCIRVQEIHFNAKEIQDLKKNNSVFYGCGDSGIGVTVNIGENVEKIPANMFHPLTYSNIYDIKIANVVFAENSVCKSIGDNAFYNCDELYSITLPSDVIQIGSFAFYGCTSLTNINIPDGVKAIQEKTFYKCKNLNSISTRNVQTIGDYAFYGCDNMTSVNMGFELLSIGKSAFSNCAKIENITIPDSVYSIGTNAFNNCTALKSVVIGESVTDIGQYAFKNCTALAQIDFNATEADNLSSSGLFDGAGESGVGITVNIGANVTKIPAYMFTNSSTIVGLKITKVIFEENSVCTNIGANAFQFCTKLASVVIPRGVSTIDAWAFRSCSSLASVYYCGEESDWATISIGTYNSAIKSDATKYWYSETAQTGCWRYVNGVPTLW